MSKELFEACENNNMEQVKESLKKWFDIQYQDKDKQTCLYWVCFHNNIKLAKLLLKNSGKNIINIINIYGQSCLYWACCNNSIELIKLLLDNGASDSINVLSVRGHSCLSWACFYSDVELVRLLLDNGAIIDEESKIRYCNFLLKVRI